MPYQSRCVESSVLKYLKLFPVVAITGPRQSGKSTLLKHLLKDQYRYLTFDNEQHVRFFYEDPIKFMRTYSDHIIFDEVQKVPEIFDAIKLAVDEDRERSGKFVITASNQFVFMKQITESLAGRIGFLSLLPFQYTEIPSNLHSDSVYRGAYPELVNRKYYASEDWYAAYLESYIEKDVRSLSNVGDIRHFRQLISLLASGTSQMLNMSRYASDLGVSVPSIKRWVSILEASYIIFLLQPYYNNHRKRLTRTPKIYFHDTGLVSYLTGIETQSQYEKGPMAGSLFENYVISEILKNEIHHKTHAQLYYYRTNHGVEVDLLIERKTKRELIEIKKSATFKVEMLKPMESLIESKDQGFLLFQGEPLKYSSNIQILPYQNYLKREK
jgi:predicted AAA+ superfamily ATPase